MSQTFCSIVEEVKQLSIDEKEELRHLIEKFVIEERRQQIYENGQASLQEYRDGKLKFSSNIEELKEMLNNLL